MNTKVPTESDTVLAMVHIGIMLSEWDPTIEKLPDTLVEIQNRIKNVFNIDMAKEPHVFAVRDKIVAMIELHGDKLNEPEIH